ncbi:MAG TPA: PLDc N-terminal domain-containing protein [Ohtaekwangia sp.]
MARLLPILWLIVVILILLDLWKQPIDQTKKILWTVLLLFLPLLGLILYVILEKSSLKR